MWKLILKNLWSRRKRNGWLMAELILVSVVTFIIIDPIVVLHHYMSQPLGYDADRLCIVELGRVDEKAPHFSEDDANKKTKLANILRVKDKLASHPDVESACVLGWAYINSQGNASSEISIDSTESFYVHRVPAFIDQQFFETYGIKSAPGSPSPEELSKTATGKNGYIITRDLAELLFPGENAVGKNMLSIHQGDTFFQPVHGVVEPITPYIMRGNDPLLFTVGPIKHNKYTPNILVRIKPEVDMKTFVGKLRPWMHKEVKAGNWFAQSVITYEDHLSNFKYTSGVTNEIRLNIAYAVFFLVNLCLGVIGTFWLQTRKRTEEAGIMRSFGATKGYIVRMLLGEGVILTIVSSLIGFFGYFQYALSEGLYVSRWEHWSQRYFQHNWIHDFGLHFTGVSVITLLILIAVVSIGIYIPARSISRTNPVNALRDE